MQSTLHWYEIDAFTRKHVTIASCYTTSPDRLSGRLKHLESVKLKGKPRAAMFNLITEDWGGHVTPWVQEPARSFDCLKSLHFRIIVKDSDLESLARQRGRALLYLKLNKCSGFSTDGLLHFARFCRNLQTLFLEESSISKNDGEWLHELALNNSVLENLNFYMTDLNKFNFENLELIARNCQSLVSVKVGNDCEVPNLDSFFHAASSLEEFGGGFFNEKSERYTNLKYPPRLCQLGQTYIGKNEMHIVFPIAKSLKKLDLLYAFLGMEDICLLIQKCHNLEVFETMNVIGDGGVGSFMGWGWMMEVLLKEAQD